MAGNAIGSIFPPDMNYEGKTIMYSDLEVTQGRVNGPYVINMNTKYDIVKAISSWTDFKKAIGIEEQDKPEGEIGPVPKRHFTGSIAGNDAVGKVAYKMIRDEIESAGYTLIELPKAEMLKRYKNADGWEDVSVGRKEIYIGAENSDEKKAEIAFHEYTAAMKSLKHRKPHAYFHPEVEAEQKEYISKIRRLMN